MAKFSHNINMKWEQAVFYVSFIFQSWLTRNHKCHESLLFLRNFIVFNTFCHILFNWINHIPLLFKFKRAKRTRHEDCLGFCHCLLRLVRTARQRCRKGFCHSRWRICCHIEWGCNPFTCGTLRHCCHCRTVWTLTLDPMHSIFFAAATAAPCERTFKVWTDRAAASAAAADWIHWVYGDTPKWIWDPFQVSWVASPLTSIGAAAAWRYRCRSVCSYP